MSTPTIAIIDYQAGNLRSVQKALERAGANAMITNDPERIQSAGGVVFPGQGANDSSMRNLRSKRLIEPIKTFIEGGRPFLGVCLGLQLLMEGSDEGTEPGLGILNGWVRQLPPGLKVPHMGWNRVDIQTRHPLLEGVPSDSYFYFVHSYYADPSDESLVTGKTTYGIEFCSAVAWDSVLAVQFHPEKSGRTGLRLYENFVRLVRG